MVCVAEKVSAGFGVTKENLTIFAAGHSQTHGDISLGRQEGVQDALKMSACLRNKKNNPSKGAS